MNRRAFLKGALALTCLHGLSSSAAGFSPGSAEADLPTETADVIVLGGGAGGLAAAISAAEAGAGRVLLLEKNERLGGDTLIAGGYFNAVIPERQSLYGIEDSVALFESQILETGQHANDPAVVGVLAKNAGDALVWLERHGMNFLPEPFEVFGSEWRRCFKPVMPRGLGYLRALTAAAYSAGVEVKLAVAAERFVRDAEGVDGVVAESANGKRTFFRARRGVVLATGGFASNRSLLRQYAPHAAALPIDSQPGSTGEMTLAASDIGAAIVNMESVECVPGSREGIDYPIRLDYIPAKMVMVDASGRRFVDENESRGVIASAIFRYGDAPCWAIADAETVAAFDGISQKNIYRGLYSGEAFRGRTVEDLAAKLHIPAEALANTLSESPGAERVKVPPFWAVQMHLRVHVTLGGVRIDRTARVLDAEGVAIPRLWACGACTGSVHGLSRIGGNGINTAVVFGRISGQSAASIPDREA